MSAKPEDDLSDIFWVCIFGLLAIGVFGLVVLITGAGNHP